MLKLRLLQILFNIWLTRIGFIFAIIFLSGCVAIRSIPPNHPFSKENAKRIYQEAIFLESNGNTVEAYDLLNKVVPMWLSAVPPISAVDRKAFYASQSLLVYELTYISALRNETKTIDQLTYNILADPDEEKQYFLIKNALSLIHLFHTGDLHKFRDVMQRERNLIERFEAADTKPAWMTMDSMITDPYFIDGLLAYAALEDGRTTDMYRTQKELEELYNKWFIQLGIFSAETLGWFSDLRTIVFGLGAYGYGMLGMYSDSEKIFKKSIEAMNSNLSSLSYLNGYVYLAYADASLIPRGFLADAEVKINTGMSLILSTPSSMENEPLMSVHPFLRPVHAYPGLVKLKLLTKQRQISQSKELADHLFSVTKSVNFSFYPVFDPATPKIYVADAIFHVAQVLDDPRALRPLLEKSKQLLGSYQGIQRWKIHYAESLLYDKDNPITSLQSAREAVNVLEQYAAEPFPNIRQQSTFWADKEIAYQRVVDLLLRIHEANLSAVASELLYYSSVSKTRINLIDYHEVMPSRDPSGPRRLLPMLQAHLPEQAAFIDYWYDDNRLLVIAASKAGRPVVFVEPIDAGELEQTVQSLRESIKSSSENNYITTGNKLYKKLLNRVLSELGDVKRLYIGPHRILHMLPWNALSVSEENRTGNQYLVEHYTMVIMPSVLSVPLATFSDLGRLPDDKKITVAIADNTELGKHPENITDSCGCNFISPESLASDNLNNDTAKAQAIFLYAHGKFDTGNPLDSQLLLSGNDGEESALDFKDIQRISHASEFIFVAGCETGNVGSQNETNIHEQMLMDTSKYPPGEQLVGLYKALLTKRTRVAALCMNEANEFGTSHLVRHILSDTRKSGDYAEIFRNAIIKTKLDSSDPNNWGWCGLIIGGSKNE